MLKESILRIYFQKNQLSLWLLISSILFLFVIFNQFFLVIKESIDTPFVTSEILIIIFLKAFSDFPILASISFLISISIVFSRMINSSELLIYSSGGIGKKEILKIISPITFILFFFLLIQNFYLNPAIDRKIDSLRDNASKNLSRFSFKEGAFNLMNNNKNMVFVSAKDSNLGKDHEIFKDLYLFQIDKEHLYSIHSSDAEKFSEGDETFFNFKKGEKFLFDNKNSTYEVLNFDNLKINLSKTNKKNFSNQTNVGTSSLGGLILNFGNSVYDAELFWRFSVSFSVFIFSLFALSAISIEPRKKNAFPMLMSISFLIFYLTIILAVKSSLLSDEIGFFEGIFFSHGLFFLIIFVVNIFYGVKKNS